MRKWWLDSVEERAADEDDLRLGSRRSTRTAAVRIETVGENAPAKLSGGAPAPIKERFLKEAHHRQYGRPWDMGRYLFDFVVDAGLPPRAPVARLRLRRAPARHPRHCPTSTRATTSASTRTSSASRPPRRTRSLSTGCEASGLACSGTRTSPSPTSARRSTTSSTSPARRASKGTSDRLRRAFASFADVLKPGGTLLTVPKPALPPVELAGLDLELVRGEVSPAVPARSRGTRTASRPFNVWNEFRRADA